MWSQEILQNKLKWTVVHRHLVETVLIIKSLVVGSVADPDKNSEYGPKQLKKGKETWMTGTVPTFFNMSV